MKTKKILSSAFAVILSCSIGITCFTGCTESCEHVYTWTVTKEATCSSEGQRDGVCGICSDVVTEVIPIDPEAHVYGEWQVTKPTQTDTGTATLTCTLNPSHVVTVALPALTDDGYTVTEITSATVTHGGLAKYSYSHDKGAIEFEVETPAKQISNMQDVVDYAAHQSSEISKAAGYTEIPLGGGQAKSNFYYEFGEDYTHIYGDGDSREFYCTADPESQQGIYAIEIGNVKYSLDANGYPVEKTSKGNAPFQNTGLSAEYMHGFLFSLGYTGISSMYGAENVLSELYSIAAENKNKDLTESPFAGMKKPDGSYEGNFSFGYYNDANYRFSVITVNFTLYDTLSIKSLYVESKIYGFDSDSQTYGFVGYNEAGTEIDLGTYDEKDEDGRPIKPVIVTCKAKPDATPVGIERIQVNQQREKDVTVPVVANPYPRNALLVDSFNVRHDNNKIVGDEPIEVSAGEAKAFTVTDIVNVADIGKPEGSADIISSLAYDPLNAYLRENGKDTPLSASTNTDPAIRVNAVISGTAVTIRCYRIGEIKIVLKTQSGNFEKEININVGNAKGPSRLEAQVNVYYDSGYEWQPYTTVVAGGAELEIYVGQTLEFTAQAPADEQSYTDASYTAEITSDNNANANLYDDNKFIASATGNYEIRLTASVANSNNRNASTYMYVTVKEVPDVATLFGAYTAAITDPENTTAEVIFRAPVYDSEANAYNGTVTVSLLGGTQTLSYTYTPATIEMNDGERTYTPPMLTTNHLSGSESLGCSLSINDAYGLTLSHPRAVAGQFEDVVLVAK